MQIKQEAFIREREAFASVSESRLSWLLGLA